jgi:tetratricopeptide (TPR) repeat protein
MQAEQALREEMGFAALFHLQRSGEREHQPGLYHQRHGQALLCLEQWEQAAGAFTEAIALSPQAWAAYAGRCLARCQLRQPELAAGDHAAAVRLGADESGLWQQRAELHTRFAQWPDAAAAFARLLELKPHEPELWHHAALTTLAAGDVDGYCRLCTRLVDRFGKTATPAQAGAMAWTCVLARDAVADSKAIVQLAEKAQAADADNADCLRTLGAALHRAGKPREALPLLNTALEKYRSASDHPAGRLHSLLLLALASKAAGREDAKSYLEKAEKEPAQELSLSWDQRLELELLRAEAEKRLRAGQP